LGVADDHALAAAVEHGAGERRPVLSPCRLANEGDAGVLDPLSQAHDAIMGERAALSVKRGVQMEPRNQLVVAVGARPVGAGLDLADQGQSRELAGELLADPAHGHAQVEPRPRGHVLDPRVDAEPHRAPATVHLLLEHGPALEPGGHGLDHAVDRAVRERQRHLPVRSDGHEFGQVRAPGGQVVGGVACVHAHIMGSIPQKVNGLVIID
jgi:hypothetical protein